MTENVKDKVVKSDAEWRQQLTPEQYHVTREAGTERAFTGKYWKTKEAGTYHCVGCGAPLFTSTTKFDSGTGWPSFDRARSADTVLERKDRGFGLTRTEIVCARCGGHLGHVFPDGPTDTGLRYCVNSLSLTYRPEAEEQAGGS